jgi:hypothetical protein
MSFVHGRHTFISLDGDDLSVYTDSSELGLTADTHDVTTYGKDAHVYEGGLTDGTAKMSGTYDNTAGVGPRAVIRPLIGSKVVLVRRTEGTGSGKPQDTVDVVVKGYTETNPVADMVKWSADLQCSDDVDSTPQA